MSEIVKVKWMEELATGNRAIDVQHKYLIDIINDLADIINQRQPKAKMGKIIQLLQYYTEWHFCREEDCMERTNCPTACQNKDAHAKFLGVVVDFKNEFSTTDDPDAIVELGVKMYKVLVSWLVSHIQAIDVALADVSVGDKTNFGA